ncbi:hypothetical protein [Amaricoccus macauensis]|uniref:hypothetical protein n=1 Tax=Amaricoccus macauensis TaxID=57001 RepID=UPI003C7A5FB5
MIRLAFFMALALASAPAAFAMETTEPIEGVTITRGPAVSPEPEWRAARRQAFILGTINQPKTFNILVRRQPYYESW